MRLNLIAFIACVVIVAGCTESAHIQTGSYKFLYDFESRDLHPEYVVYHDSDDSSKVYFRIYSKELLYTRNSSMAPFVSRIAIKTYISDAQGNLQDTLTFKVNDAAKPAEGWLLGDFKVPLGIGNWNVTFEFTDLARNVSQINYVNADKSSNYTGQNYLLLKYETGEPVFGGFVSSGQKVEVISARNEDAGRPQLLRLSGELKLPPPPFSTNAPEITGLTGATGADIKINTAGVYSFVVASGNYFVTHDENVRTGLTILTASTFYPEIREVESLQWPLRYITTKTEHDEIVKNNYPKKMIDQFWIECAGNKEHAREMISIYYHRVEEANKYFSSFTEGWRTDRGMIHLIFGNPSKINRFGDSETWQYGEEGTAGLLMFVFRRVESPLSNNIYVLDRDPNFKPYWEKMVQTWRNGRVYSE